MAFVEESSHNNIQHLLVFSFFRLAYGILFGAKEFSYEFSSYSCFLFKLLWEFQAFVMF